MTSKDSSSSSFIYRSRTWSAKPIGKLVGAVIISPITEANNTSMNFKTVLAYQKYLCNDT